MSVAVILLSLSYPPSTWCVTPSVRFVSRPGRRGASRGGRMVPYDEVARVGSRVDMVEEMGVVVVVVG